MKRLYISGYKKTFILSFLINEYILSLEHNELDEFLKSELSKYYFGQASLGDFYSNRGFNCNCQIGSLLCMINLPSNINCNLIRGELLSDVECDDFSFVHGWIEIIYNGIEYVIDTSIGRTILKDTYYKLFRPAVYTILDNETLFKNDYIKYFKEELKQKNDLTLTREFPTVLYGEGSFFDLYENYWLDNITDNSVIGDNLTKIRKRTNNK